MSSVIEGKMYNRTVRIHKYIYEALLRLIWKQFIPWVSANHANKVSQARDVVAKVNEMAEAVSQEQFDSILHSQSFEELYQLWDQYLQYELTTEICLLSGCHTLTLLKMCFWD